MMKFHTITVDPADTEIGWVVNFTTTETTKNLQFKDASAYGVMHYEGDIGDAEAFNILKEKMIIAHQNEIERLQKSLKSLSELKFNDWKGEVLNDEVVQPEA